MFAVRLRRGGTVTFTIVQVSPSCTTVGTFQRKGHAGVNRFAFHGRVHGRTLRPGTYSIRARSHGSVVLNVRLVVVGRETPSPAAVAAARMANVCAASSRAGSAARRALASLTRLAAGGGPRAGARAGKHAAKSARSSRKAGEHHVLAAGPTSGNVLPHSKPLRIGLLLVLLVAILLLGLGALPRSAVPHTGAAAALAHRRAEIAAAGGLAFVAFLLVYFL